MALSREEKDLLRALVDREISATEEQRLQTEAGTLAESALLSHKRALERISERLSK